MRCLLGESLHFSEAYPLTFLPTMMCPHVPCNLCAACSLDLLVHIKARTHCEPCHFADYALEQQLRCSIFAVI